MNEQFTYSPKEDFVSEFVFAWDNLKFRKKLELYFKDFCDLEGTVVQLKVTPKKFQVCMEIIYESGFCSDGIFTEKVVGL